jgi:hypothetical protein
MKIQRKKRKLYRSEGVVRSEGGLRIEGREEFRFRNILGEDEIREFTWMRYVSEKEANEFIQRSRK